MVEGQVGRMAIQEVVGLADCRVVVDHGGRDGVAGRTIDLGRRGVDQGKVEIHRNRDRSGCP